MNIFFEGNICRSMSVVYTFMQLDSNRFGTHEESMGDLISLWCFLCRSIVCWWHNYSYYFDKKNACAKPRNFSSCNTWVCLQEILVVWTNSDNTVYTAILKTNILDTWFGLCTPNSKFESNTNLMSYQLIEETKCLLSHLVYGKISQKFFL